MMTDGFQLRGMMARMRRTILTSALLAWALASVPFALHAQSPGKGPLGELADDVGNINAWRLIPDVLLARCTQETPAAERAMRDVNQRWHDKHAPFILFIDRLVTEAAPLLAEGPEAKQKLNRLTEEQIRTNYFGDARYPAAGVCQDYPKIVRGLSDPGRLATIRGFAHAAEALLFPGQGKPGGLR